MVRQASAPQPDAAHSTGARCIGTRDPEALTRGKGSKEGLGETDPPPRNTHTLPTPGRVRVSPGDSVSVLPLESLPATGREKGTAGGQSSGLALGCRDKQAGLSARGPGARPSIRRQCPPDSRRAAHLDLGSPAMRFPNSPRM